MLSSDFSPEKQARQRFLKREQELREARRGFDAVVQLSNNPKVKEFVKKAFPDYKQPKVLFVVADSVALEDAVGLVATKFFGIRPDGSRFSLRHPKTKISDRQIVVKVNVFGRNESPLIFHVTRKFLNKLIKGRIEEIMLPSDFSPERQMRQEDLREARGNRVAVQLSSNPKVKAFVKKAFPDYRKREVVFNVGAGQEVSLSGGYWDGGSRTEWFGIRPDGSRYALTYPTAPPQFGGGKVPTVKVTDRDLVARGGSFAAKPVTLSFFVTDSVAHDLGIRT